MSYYYRIIIEVSMHMSLFLKDSKIPKSKLASSSYSASQVKKCKKKQREDLIKSQQEREHDKLWHQLKCEWHACPDSLRDSQEWRQECNTETTSLDPIRRQQGQDQNTAACQQARQEDLEETSWAGMKHTTPINGFIWRTQRGDN